MALMNGLTTFGTPRLQSILTSFDFSSPRLPALDVVSSPRSERDVRSNPNTRGTVTRSISYFGSNLTPSSAGAGSNYGNGEEKQMKKIGNDLLPIPGSPLDFQDKLAFGSYVRSKVMAFAIDCAQTTWPHLAVVSHRWDPSPNSERYTSLPPSRRSSYSSTKSDSGLGRSALPSPPSSPPRTARFIVGTESSAVQEEYEAHHELDQEDVVEEPKEQPIRNKRHGIHCQPGLLIVEDDEETTPRLGCGNQPAEKSENDDARSSSSSSSLYSGDFHSSSSLNCVEQVPPALPAERLRVPSPGPSVPVHSTLKITLARQTTLSVRRPNGFMLKQFMGLESKDAPLYAGRDTAVDHAIVVRVEHCFANYRLGPWDDVRKHRSDWSVERTFQERRRLPHLPPHLDVPLKPDQTTKFEESSDIEVILAHPKIGELSDGAVDKVLRWVVDIIKETL